MPSLTTTRVLGSQAIATRRGLRARVFVVAMEALLRKAANQSLPAAGSNSEPTGRLAWPPLPPPFAAPGGPAVFAFGFLQSGSRLREALVKFLKARTVLPYITTAVVESCAPGGSSTNGMNLWGNPGIVHPMQTPPTFGQSPTPLIHPRLPTLHCTTGPQQPSLTMHLGEPTSNEPAKS